MVGGFHLEEPQNELDDEIQITVDARYTNLKWNEFVRYVQWLLLQGTCISIMAL
jgi:hypothetical protein